MKRIYVLLAALAAFVTCGELKADNIPVLTGPSTTATTPETNAGGARFCSFMNKPSNDGDREVIGTNDYNHMVPGDGSANDLQWSYGTASLNHFKIRCYTSGSYNYMEITINNAAGTRTVIIDYTPDITTINTIVIQINKLNQNSPNSYIKLLNLKVNGDACIPNILTKTVDPQSAEYWTISGIDCSGGEFVLEGDVELTASADYDNGDGNGQNLVDFFFGNVDDGGGGGEPSGGGEIILDFDPCVATEVPSDDPHYIYHATDGMINLADNPEAPDSAVAPDWCMRPLISDCFIGEEGNLCGLAFSESPCYGMSSLLEFDANPLVTSDWETVQIPIPDDTLMPGKHFFVAFRPADLNDDDIQTIFEAGGAISGFNVYIQGGTLVMGIWNRLQRFAFAFGPALNTQTTYLAHMEMIFVPAVIDNGVTIEKPYYKVRMILNGAEISGEPPLATPFTISTDFYKFKGLQWDPSQSAIGGESHGTTYNVNWGVFNNYARWFTGCIGRIQLYNGDIDAQTIYDLYNLAYNTDYLYPTEAPYPPLPPVPKHTDWRFYDNSVIDGTNNVKVEIYPNPATGRASIDLLSGTEQNARVDLYDMAGVRVLNAFDGKCPQGRTSVSVECSALPPGVYTVRVKAGDNLSVGKLIILK